MVHTRLPRGIAKILALLYFALRTDRPEVLHAVDPIDTARGLLQRDWVLEIPLNNLDTLVHQPLHGEGVCFEGERAQLPALGKQVTDHGSALPPKGWKLREIGRAHV